MKYYIATSTMRAAAHNMVRDGLKKLGHEITYDWTTHGSVRLTSRARLQEVAHVELQGILDSDFVVILLPGGKGTHTELGFSIASKKRVLIHSEDPALFEIGPETCAFYHHTDVIQFSSSIKYAAEIAHSLIIPAIR